MIFSALKRFAARQRESDDVTRAFHHCFHSEDGKIVLEHLHNHVLFRVTDPNMPNDQLRFIEGQRQLVLYICQQISKP